MMIEHQIDRLIDAGWTVLESDFDAEAFHDWKRKAYECLNSILGPDHAYTQYFSHCVNLPETGCVLAGRGILSAAKEEITLLGAEAESFSRKRAS